MKYLLLSIFFLLLSLYTAFYDNFLHNKLYVSKLQEKGIVYSIYNDSGELVMKGDEISEYVPKYAIIMYSLQVPLSLCIYTAFPILIILGIFLCINQKKYRKPKWYFSFLAIYILYFVLLRYVEIID